MSRPAFAMLPSAWVKAPRLSVITPGQTTPPAKAVELENSDYGAGTFATHGLAMLQRRAHGSGATAALLVLFALAVISNRAQRTLGKRQDNQVAATYEQIQAMVALSRKLISEALQLLVMVDAIAITRDTQDSRRNLYALKGIERSGGYCMLPQHHLQNGHSHLQRLKHFIDHVRNPMSLHALKVYMLILQARDRHTNMASIGYEKIGLYTGLRREDISTAVNLLISLQLLRKVTDEEHPRRPQDPHHNRYSVCGLTAF
jgi:hypothetical protein